MAPIGADILITNDSRRIAAVEIKNLADLSRDRAIWVRHSLLAHGLLPHTPYLLVVSQDRGFLWHDAPASNPDAPPDYEFSMRDVLSRRFPAALITERLRESELATLVYAWLSELTWDGNGELDESIAGLRREGFLDAIHHGILSMATER